jgi:hypothetical protein
LHAPNQGNIDQKGIGMRKTIAKFLVGFAAVAAPIAGAFPAHAVPMEWAWIGPYSSTWTCEQARDDWPMSSQPCVQRSDGAYFYGLRQA